MATTQNLQTAAKNAVADAREGDFQGLKQNLGVVARQAGKVVGKELGKARRSATDHPYAAAGVTFGAGALIGALLHALLRPAPTALEVVVRALKNSAAATRSSFVSGLRTVRRAAHH